MFPNSYLKNYLNKKESKSEPTFGREIRQKNKLEKSLTVYLGVRSSFQQKNNFITVSVPPKLVMKKSICETKKSGGMKYIGGDDRGDKVEFNNPDNEIRGYKNGIGKSAVNLDLSPGKDAEVKEAWCGDQRAKSGKRSCAGQGVPMRKKSLLNLSKLWKNPANSEAISSFSDKNQQVEQFSSSCEGMRTNYQESFFSNTLHGLQPNAIKPAIITEQDIREVYNQIPNNDFVKKNRQKEKLLEEFAKTNMDTKNMRDLVEGQIEDHSAKRDEVVKDVVNDSSATTLNSVSSTIETNNESNPDDSQLNEGLLKEITYSDNILNEGDKGEACSDNSNNPGLNKKGTFSNPTSVLTDAEKPAFKDNRGVVKVSKSYCNKQSNCVPNNLLNERDTEVSEMDSNNAPSSCHDNLSSLQSCQDSLWNYKNTDEDVKDRNEVCTNTLHGKDIESPGDSDKGIITFDTSYTCRILGKEKNIGPKVHKERKRREKEDGVPCIITLKSEDSSVSNEANSGSIKMRSRRNSFVEFIHRRLSVDKGKVKSGNSSKKVNPQCIIPLKTPEIMPNKNEGLAAESESITIGCDQKTQRDEMFSPISQVSILLNEDKNDSSTQEVVSSIDEDTMEPINYNISEQSNEYNSLYRSALRRKIDELKQLKRQNRRTQALISALEINGENLFEDNYDSDNIAQEKTYKKTVPGLRNLKNKVLPKIQPIQNELKNAPPQKRSNKAPGNLPSTDKYCSASLMLPVDTHRSRLNSSATKKGRKHVNLESMQNANSRESTPLCPRVINEIERQTEITFQDSGRIMKVSNEQGKYGEIKEMNSKTLAEKTHNDLGTTTGALSPASIRKKKQAANKVWERLGSGNKVSETRGVKDEPVIRPQKAYIIFVNNIGNTTYVPAVPKPRS